MSWQATVFKGFLRLGKWQSKNKKIPDVATFRKEVEKVFNGISSFYKKPLIDKSNLEDIHIGNMKANLYKHPENTEKRLVIWNHGGGYTYRVPGFHSRGLFHLVNQLKCDGLIYFYRLAPEHPYPAAVEDTMEAYEWALSQGYDPQNIVIASDSAGSNLTLLALIRLRDKNIPMPAASCLLSPWVDLTLSGESFTTRAKREPMYNMNMMYFLRDNIRGELSPDTPELSSVTYELKNPPPTKVLYGSEEALASDSELICEKLKQAGVDAEVTEYKGMVHIFPLFADLLPEAREGIKEMVTFYEKHLNKSH